MWLNHKDFLIDPEEVAAKRELQFKGMGRKLKAQKTRATQAAAKTDLTEEESLPHFRPMSVFLGHRGAVSSLCWPTLHHLYSGSHDYTIKHWDLQTSTATHSWSSGHVVNAIDFSTPMNLIASGDQDGYVRFYDPRIGSEEAVTNSTKGSIKACATWVSDVKWAPSVLNAPHLLATASYDGIVKFWDIRSSKPLHSLDTSSERLLAVDWVPAVAPVEGVPAQTYTLVGGTGKVLDRISWKINV
jgi:ribosome biogenesis protein YTM1